MIELKIDPEFENLIPKLTDAEFAQLEKNILADNKVKEPIVVWNGTIIDGHHRYYIVKKHPEIPFEIEEKDFANRYEAMAWACANQLGRRNVSPEDRAYLIGKQYEAEKRAIGENQHTISRVGKDYQPSEGASVSNNVTSARVGRQHGVSEKTVRLNEEYAKGIDIADSIVPGIKDEILHGDINVPKSFMEKLQKVTPDKQRKATIAISEKDINSAGKILNDEPLKDKQESLKQYGLEDDGKEVEFTIDDLYSDIETNFEKCMDGLENTVSLHKNILDDDNKQNLIDKLKKLFNQKVRKFMEGI